MSGGSYDYICYASPDELMEKLDSVQSMADRLAELGYADDAAKETQILLLTIRQYRNRIDAMHERLSNVWKAVEWWESGDTREDGVKQELKAYRGGETDDRA